MVTSVRRNADRTNAVAAFLTVPCRLLWPGGKPFNLITANKSHAGKTTVCEFINIDQTAAARIEYDPHKDWPMQNQLCNKLTMRPEVGIISFDNVKTRGASLISSGYVESFVTASEVVIGKATGNNKPRCTANKFVVMLNSNVGSLSIDLLNRSLPIRLAPSGDVTQRKSPIGNPKLEYLPANRRQIEAERWGMIDRWVRAGKPLDESMAHYPMGPCAKVIGGILMDAAPRGGPGQRGSDGAGVGTPFQEVCRRDVRRSYPQRQRLGSNHLPPGQEARTF